jgi:Arc/MetJ-type ribon-helix-helix transcriptional regulator
VTRKPRVVTFRLDQATWDWMKRLVPYTRYRTTSSFIREGIDLLLKREDARRRVSGGSPWRSEKAARKSGLPSLSRGSITSLERVSDAHDARCDAAIARAIIRAG